MSLTRFLTHGYFPYELPQCFSSSSYGQLIGNLNSTSAIPNSLLKPTVPGSSNRFRTAPLLKHNLARVNRFRRILGVPNPILYMNLCKEITDNWEEIDSFIKGSSLSYTQPAFTDNGNRAFNYNSLPSNLPQIRAHHRSNGKYLLVTDIQQFYPSIYTHSLPWALHTKDVAKSQRTNYQLTGNRLDRCVRNMQDSQTMGLPLGPDSSRILSEILLTAVDMELLKEYPDLKGFRRIDDYELTFRTRSEAETALGILQGILSEFELSLNESKTHILELPLPLEETWTFTFKTFNFEARSPLSIIQNLTSYFGLAFDLAPRYPQSSVIGYAISRIKNEDFSNRLVWKVYQNLLIQSMIAEPGAIRYVLFELQKYKKKFSLRIDQDKIQDALEQMIQPHYALGHGSEIAWSIWATIILNVQLSELSCNIISQINEPLVPLLALHAESLGLTKIALDHTHWSSLMTEEELWGNNWLLCYEANVKNWLPSVGNVDHVNNDPAFLFLKENNVVFYDLNAINIAHSQWESRFSISDLVGYTSSDEENMDEMNSDF